MLPKALASLFFIGLLFTAHAQGGKAAKPDSAKTVQVVVTVVNVKKQPRKGEQVIFINKKTNQVYNVRTGNTGQANFALPSGENFVVTLKTLTDTTQYGEMATPPLGPGEYFKDPLTVDITYEPARNFTLTGLQFDNGKATIRPTSIKQLQELYDYLQWKEDEKVEIDGHTDNVGKDDDNLALSQQRADAVKSWLVKKGIASNRIIAKGYGSTQPIADNTDEDGRQKNRRTEVKIL